MRSGFILSCESTIDLPYSYCEQRDIPVLFYSYQVDGVSYEDDMGRDPAALPRFYGFLDEGKLPTTAQLNEFQYESFFDALLQQGDVLHIAFGSGMTASVQNAMLAAESLRSAELNMDNLQEAMNNYTITSPISGTIIEKNAKAGDALSAGSDLCTIFDLSYLEMTLNVDELQVSSLSVGQSVQVTADAVPDKTYTGVVTRVSMKGTSNGGTTTYPVKVRIDETDGLRPGMNANAEIVVAQAKNTLTVPNAAIVRGGYVLVTQDSPSAVNADPGMIAPDGYVYVPVKTGVSDDNYTQIVSGLTGNDTVAYDSAAASTDTYYDDGGYYEADAEGTEGEEGADAANSMVDEEEPENGTVPAEEPVEAEEKQGSAEDAVNPSQADGVVYLG